MGEKDAFRIEIVDGRVGLVMSDEFLSKSLEEQMEALKEYFVKKASEPYSTLDVTTSALEEEYAYVVAETLWAKLANGERIEAGTQIDISVDQLERIGGE